MCTACDTAQKTSERHLKHHLEIVCGNKMKEKIFLGKFSSCPLKALYILLVMFILRMKIYGFFDVWGWLVEEHCQFMSRHVCGRFFLMILSQACMAFEFSTVNFMFVYLIVNLVMQDPNDVLVPFCGKWLKKLIYF